MNLNARQRRDRDHAKGRHSRQPDPDCFGCAIDLHNREHTTPQPDCLSCWSDRIGGSK